MDKYKHKRHPILNMACANMDVWIHTPRAIIMLLCVSILCYLEINTVLRQYSRFGWTLNLIEIPYKFLEYGMNLSMSSILMLVMISELPRQLAYQNTMLIRTCRGSWLTAQILYCFFIVFCVLVLLVLCAFGFSIEHTTFGLEWTDNARIASGKMQNSEAIVPQIIRDNYSPITAAGLAFLPMFLFWFCLGNIIILCTLLGSQDIGVIICAFIILGHYIGSYDFPYLTKYATISGMDLSIYGMNRYIHIIECYAVLELILVAFMYWYIKRSDLIFNYGNNR